MLLATNSDSVSAKEKKNWRARSERGKPRMGGDGPQSAFSFLPSVIFLFRKTFFFPET